MELQVCPHLFPGPFKSCC
uniref:Uncharacterized protein n=1 Tax=Rhizophora mucronata TaxID=61149 RepID=A0A2P2Q726_RHIMU